MKRTLILLLLCALLLSLCACQNTGADGVRVDFEYPEDYLSRETYPMDKILRDTEKYYKAVSKAYPDRPVLVLITHKMLSGFSVEHNDAINRWLEENGYGFSLMIYGLPFRTEEIRAGLTFEEKLCEYIDRGGRCDLILPDPNWSALSGCCDDTVWDYVHDGLIIPLEDAATDEQLEAVAEIYGEKFLEANTEKGKLYGLSFSDLEGTKYQSYVAVKDSVLPLVEGKTPEELGDMLVYDGEFLELARQRGESAAAVSVLSLSLNEMLGPFVTGDRYASLNNLPIYADLHSEEPKALGLWEIPGFWEFAKAVAGNVDAGLWASNGEIKNGAAAVYLFSSYSDETVAESVLRAMLEENGVTESYTLLPLPGYPVNVGVENAVLLCAHSEYPELSCEAAVKFAVDGELGRVMSSGVEGRSYVYENGVPKYLHNPFGVCVIPNSFWSVPVAEHLMPLGESCERLQAEDSKYLYGLLSLDTSSCEESADALAAWGVDLGFYLSVGNSDGFTLRSGETAESFPSLPVPDIAPLKSAYSGK
ncbi:MAG: hypothetical protein IJY86_06585 [Clostridia bacterium]|nr:hypothetical protein [Clostridia bacterium]